MFKKFIRWLLNAIISIIVFMAYFFFFIFLFYNFLVPNYLSADTIILLGFIVAIFLYYSTIDSILKFLKENWS